MLRVVVADDERVARLRLVRLLENTRDATIVAACAGGATAVNAIVDPSGDQRGSLSLSPPVRRRGFAAALLPA